MIHFADVASNTPYIITLFSVLGTMLVFVLVTFAKVLFKDMGRTIDVVAWRMNFLGHNDFKIKMAIHNMSGSIAEMKSISLLIIQDGKPKIISLVRDMPIQGEDEDNCIYGDAKEGYYVKIDASSKHYVVFDFHLDEGNEIDGDTKVYFSFINANGLKRIAKINLFTDQAQLLRFKTLK